MQFSLGSLLCLIVGIGSVVASLVPRGEFAPIIGWGILAAIYWRQFWGDLLFVHGVLPAISVSMLGVLVLFAAIQTTSLSFWQDLANTAYWLLFVSCLAGNILSQIYYVYLLLVVDPQPED